ncbi:alpha-amylase family protein [Dermatophilaceae bacterium Sec6.4]
MEQFELRVQRWLPDLVAAVQEAYPQYAESLVDEIVQLAATAYAQRDPELHRLDAERLLRPDWLQEPAMFGYACYAERFAGDLVGVSQQIPYLQELGVNYLHLMPLLTPRAGDSDGGYAVQDYRSVRADLGTVADLRQLATSLREQGISLVLDLVLNHVAREHDWAVAARAGDPTYRDYFYVYPDRTVPDQIDATVPEVFPDFAPGNFTWDAEAGGWVWTTFNSFQWDLNWSNPAVLREFIELIFHLSNLGVQVLRLDAIAFLWKRIGTDCQNQPEVHAITAILRTAARIACPATVFKAEAIVGPRDLIPYLGRGRYAGKVSDLAYQNSLMVQIWSMLATGDTRLARRALGELPPKPTGGTWICYVRCHDDIGWAIDDGDAAAVGVSGPGHRSFLSDWYSGIFAGSTADGLVFQENEQTGDRRISGTAASLAGVNAVGQQQNDALARVYLAHAIAIGWGGIPVIWSGDELGALNDVGYADEPGHDADNRWAHRPRLTDEMRADRDRPHTVAGRVFPGIVHLAQVRARTPQLHASAESRVVADTDDGLLLAVRQHPSGPMVCAYNITDQWRPMQRSVLTSAGIHLAYDVLESRDVGSDDQGALWLSPYSAAWIVNRDEVPA